MLLVEGRVGRGSLSCRNSVVSREVSLARQVFEVFLLSPLNYSSPVCSKASAYHAGFVLAVVWPCHICDRLHVLCPSGWHYPLCHRTKTWVALGVTPHLQILQGCPASGVCSVPALLSLLWDSNVVMGAARLATNGSIASG